MSETLRSLIVEDSEDDAALLEQALRRSGYAPQARRVASEVEFVAALEEPAWDVIIADYRLPGFGALRVLDLLKEREIDLPVIVVSGTAGEEELVGAMRAGGRDYVLKDNLNRLVPAIRREMEQTAARRARQETERALRANEERFRFVVENAGDVLYRLRFDTMTYDYMSQGIEKLTGYTMPEINAIGFARLVLSVARSPAPGLDREKLVQERLARRDQEFRADYQVRTKSGEIKWLADHSFPWRDNGGRLLGSVGILLDITERKRAEEETRLLQALALAIGAAPDLESALGVVLKTVCETTGWVLGQAWLPAGDGNALECVPAWYAQAADLERFRVVSEGLRLSPGEGLPGRVWKSRQAAWIRDVTDTVDFARAAAASAAHLKSAMAVPVLEGDRVVGVLEFLTLQQRAEDERLMKVVSAVASQLGAVIHRKQAEDSLRQSEERFRSLVENASDLILGIDRGGALVYLSPSITRTLGYKPREITGRSLLEFAHPDDVRQLSETFHYLPSTPMGMFVEARIRHKDGSWRTLEAVARQRVDEAGNLTFVVSARDVTERKREEAALREREESFRLLFENNPLPMWVFDRETLAFLQVNEAAVDHYGYTRKEFLGMRITDIRPPEDVPGLLERLQATPRPRIRKGAWRHRVKDGRIIDVEVTAHDIDFAGRAGVMVVVQDVTERKRLEQQFLQAQKMEAVGRLAGGVAHDFNNLITAISGYGDLTLRRMGAADPLRRNVEQIRKAAERAGSLTQQLLAFSRKQVLQSRVLDLGEVVDRVQELLGRLIGEDVELVTRKEARGKVKADPTQMEQVLMNLAVNARDAMPKGGRLTIEVQDAELDDKYALEHVSVVPGPYVMVAVSDTGHGMDAETRSHVFEPFFTTKEVGKGTGLGLATVYGIVKQSGGYIWVYSEPGQGTTFKIYLPRAEVAAQPPAERAAVAPVPAGSETILLLEDDAPVRELLRELLAESGYKVLEASRPRDALQLSREYSGAIHLLITDVVMPEMAGPDLARRLARERRDMKVLYMSGYTAGAVADRGILDEGVAFLQKPFTAEDLAAKVREALGQG